MKITIPNKPNWEQIGGDMNPGTYGGLIASSDGRAIELRQIQPVREYVGDSEAEDVGFPFWSKDGYYTLDDLSLDNDDVQSALDYIGIDDDEFVEKFTPTQRAMAIAEALLQYGSGADEGPGGWAEDVVPDKVKWWGGTGGPEYLADEEDDFRRDILGEDDEDDDY
jgi:hypothetical protein